MAGGLSIPYGGNGYNMNLRGAGRQGSILTQFYVGAPCLTIGDISNPGTNPCVGLSIGGLSLSYGASQTGQTASQQLIIGVMYDSEIFDIELNNFTNPAYDCVAMPNANFSNNFRNFFIWGWQRHGMIINAFAQGVTGNHFDNIYMTVGGNPTYPLMSGNFINFANQVQEFHMNRLNCEWSGTNAVFAMPSGVDGLTITAMHCEGVQFCGFNPSIFNGLAISATVDTLDIVSPNVTNGSPAGNPMSGEMYILNDYTSGLGFASNINIHGLNFIAYATGNITSATLGMLVENSTLNDDVSVMSVESLRTRDGRGGANINMWQGLIATDSHLAVSANALVMNWGLYKYGVLGSIISKATLYVTGTYTLYGQLEDTTIIVPTTITPFTLTLAHTMGATGNQLPRIGNTVHVRRQTGSASGTLTIADATGGTITTNAAGAVDLYFIYAGVTGGTVGSAWIAFTPVT